MQEKHGVQVLRTPPDILIEFLKTWDIIAKEESAKNPFFKKVLDSQRAYASIVVPAKRFMFPPYSFAANYYFPEKGAGAGREGRAGCGQEVAQRNPGARSRDPRIESRARRLVRRAAFQRGSVRRLCMSEPSPGLIKLVNAIDKFTDTTGTWISWLSVPLVLAVSYEVISRYFFNAPTIWSFDVTYMLYGTIFMLGAAYALHKGAHIRTDFFFERWSVRTKGMIDSIAYLVFFFPSLILLFIVSANEALVRVLRSARPRNRRRGGRSCGRSRWWCRSPACCCSSRACPRRSRASGPRAPASSSSTKRRSEI